MKEFIGHISGELGTGRSDLLEKDILLLLIEINTKEFYDFLVVL